MTGTLLASTYQLWLPAIGAFLVVADPLQRADAIVPLAGGADRAASAAQLFRQGYAGWFVATDLAPDGQGAGMLSSKENAPEAIRRGVPAERICTTAAIVTSTYTEAQAVRALAEQRRWSSLIVVTSPAHTRRAQLLFREVFAGSGVAVIVRPAAELNADPAPWWQSPGERSLSIREYLKLAASLVGYR